MPPPERPLRAVFFDAGNTLLQMNYTVIAAELMRHGVRVAPEEVQRAEWRGGGRLDAGRLPRAPPGGSTQSRAAPRRSFRFVVGGAGGADAAATAQVGERRRADKHS